LSMDAKPDRYRPRRARRARSWRGGTRRHVGSDPHRADRAVMIAIGLLAAVKVAGALRFSETPDWSTTAPTVPGSPNARYVLGVLGRTLSCSLSMPSPASPASSRARKLRYRPTADGRSRLIHEKPGGRCLCLGDRKDVLLAHNQTIALGMSARRSPGTSESRSRCWCDRLHTTLLEAWKKYSCRWPHETYASRKGEGQDTRRANDRHSRRSQFRCCWSRRHGRYIVWPHIIQAVRACRSARSVGIDS